MIEWALSPGRAVAIEHIGGFQPTRAEDHLERLTESGVQLPGGRRTGRPAVPTGRLALRAEVAAALRRRAGLNTGDS